MGEVLRWPSRGSAQSLRAIPGLCYSQPARLFVGRNKNHQRQAGMARLASTSEMPVRRPDLPRYMPDGIDIPLGARALYLGSSLCRIHGSNEPWTIGANVSSGCIRMRNEDVTDLYQRVKVGTKVVVI